MNYYNDNDKKACAWLRELIAARLIPNGEVDERSIADVQADDLRGFVQCHFFAGIAGWSYALQLAGWPEDRPVWTGSCPCQSFSSAGKGKGTSDHRDLWPVFAALIRECRPPVVFGEQVEAAIRYGWLDRLRADMEAEGYAVGGHILGAHSAGADHIRQRLYWVAESKHAERRPVGISGENGCDGEDARRAETHGIIGTCGEVHRLADAEPQHHGAGESRPRGRGEPSNDSATDRVEHASVHGHDNSRQGLKENGAEGTLGGGNEHGQIVRASPADGVGDVRGQGLPERVSDGPVQRETLESPQGKAIECGSHNHWSDAIPILCRDGKTRRVPPEPALFPLAHGLPGRVGLLRGVGNAIVPQVAAEFIKAYMSYERTT